MFIISNVIYTSRIYTLFLLSLVVLQLVLTLLEFFHLQYYIFIELYHQDQLNTLLINSVNKIHPLLLYLACIKLVVHLSQHVYHPTNPITFQLLPILLKQVLSTFVVATMFLILTLLLGSWWAAQEGSWGGWWNWDASEFFGLLTLFLLLLLVHQVATTFSFIFYKTLLTNYASVIISFFMLLQINFTDVSHNFGFHNSTFNNLLLLQILALVFTLSYLTSVRSIYTVNYKYFLLSFTLPVTSFLLPRLLMSFLFVVNVVTIFIIPLLLEFGILLTHLYIDFTTLIFTVLVIITCLLLYNPYSYTCLNIYFLLSPLILLFFNNIHLSRKAYSVLHMCLILCIFLHCYFVHFSIVFNNLEGQPFFTDTMFNTAYLVNNLQLTTISTDGSSSFDVKLLKLEYTNQTAGTVYFTDLIFQKFITTYVNFADLSLCLIVLSLYTSFLRVITAAIRL